MKKNRLEITKVALVIPTIRSLEFLKDWQEQFNQVDEHRYEISVFICEDHPTKEVIVPELRFPALGKTFHYSWSEIDEDLGEDSWIISRKVSAIRNYGFIQAYKYKCDVIITIDDDCFPIVGHNLIEAHVRNLSKFVPKSWVNTYPDSRHFFTRGMPYNNRNESRAMISHGLWTNVLDHDGKTHLENLNYEAYFHFERLFQIIPTGVYYPMCSMNLAFHRDITPIMYFPLMGEDNQGNKWGYDRFDDIWAGIFSKKIMDHLGFSVVNGAPMVEHRKASNPLINIQKEASGIEVNEILWRKIDEIKLSSTDVIGCYLELAQKARFPQKEYFKKLKKAMQIWCKLFD